MELDYYEFVEGGSLALYSPRNKLVTVVAFAEENAGHEIASRRSNAHCSNVACGY